MIDHIGETTAAAGAKPVLWTGQERLALTLPLRIVAALRCGWAALVVVCLAALLTETSDVVSDDLAAGTDAIWLERHQNSSR